MTTVDLDISQEQQALPNGVARWIETENATQLRNVIFRTEDRPEEIVEVPEWHVRILIRAMSGTDLAYYESLRDDESGRIPLRMLFAETVRMCCYHPQSRQRIFQPADRDGLMDEKNGNVIANLARTAVRLSGALPTQQQALAKNLSATLVSLPSTNSPKPQDGLGSDSQLS